MPVCSANCNVYTNSNWRLYNRNTVMIGIRDMEQARKKQKREDENARKIIKKKQEGTRARIPKRNEIADVVRGTERLTS